MRARLIARAARGNYAVVLGSGSMRRLGFTPMHVYQGTAILRQVLVIPVRGHTRSRAASTKYCILNLVQMYQYD